MQVTNLLAFIIGMLTIIAVCQMLCQFCLDSKEQELEELRLRLSHKDPLPSWVTQPLTSSSEE